MSIPLGPGCLLAVGEIERIDHVAALPAVVGWAAPAAGEVTIRDMCA
jgi:hypothetical protein